jgi:serine/threonine protein kinase
MSQSRSKSKVMASPRNRLSELIGKFLNDSQKPTYLDKVARLSVNKAALANVKLARLEAMQMLDAESLAILLDRVSFKLADKELEIKEALIVENNEVQMVFIPNGPSFMGCLSGGPGQYMSGGFAKVAPAQSLPIQGDKFDHAIKIMHGGDQKNIEDAKHEARFNRIMGRKCCLFQFEGKPSLVTDWQNGVSLKELLDKNRIDDYPFEQRLAWLITLLQDLDKMHEYFFVHNDIQTKNVIVDTEKSTMRLIDFGISHREKIKDGDYDIAISRDLCDLAQVIIRSLFRKELSDSSVIYREAMEGLIHALVPLHERAMQCTSRQALNFCRMLLKEHKDLSAEKLKSIQAQTIDRSDLQVEDVLRGSERPCKI